LGAASLGHIPTMTLFVSCSMLTASKLQQAFMVSNGIDKTHVRLLTFWMSTICKQLRSGKQGVTCNRPGEGV
jgi:hypothetical protein